MSVESKQMISAADSDVMDSSNEMPPMSLVTLLIMLALVMLFLGGIYLDRHAGSFNSNVYDPYTYAYLQTNRPPDPGEKMRVRGRRIFDNTCAGCHQASGLGIPGQFPPLAGSEWVQAPGANKIIRIVLNGFQGPVEVKGSAFNSVMVSWRDTLKDDEIAAVITYIRQNREWGNSASAVTPEQVKAIRDKTADKGGANWTAEELKSVPDSD